MASLTQENSRITPSRLREMTSRFFTRPQEERTKQRQLLKSVLDRFRSLDWSVYMFGGMLRDIATGGASVIPRDLDLVVSEVSTERLVESFEGFVQRINRFGGVNLRIDEWDIDIWPLDQTWAFKECQGLEASIENLPATTFLNVEAVVVEADTIRGRARSVYDNGFFEAINSRTLEVNFATNPHPISCVIRSLVTSHKLGYRLGPKLCRFIVQHASLGKIPDLMAVQRAHYGHIKLTKSFVRRWLIEIHEHVEAGKKSPLMPAGMQEATQTHLWQGRQLDLWMQTKPSVDSRPEDWTY